jgi:hypothetical protein
MGAFIVSVGALCGVVSIYHPEKPSVPRTFPNGLEVELGGKGALPVCVLRDSIEFMAIANLTRHGPMSRHNAQEAAQRLYIHIPYSSIKSQAFT